jgi:hypothetical protein
MKKLILCSIVLTSILVKAQTTLPTSWDAAGTAPTGWTLSNTGLYGSSGNPAPAVRFDNTADYMDIWFSDEPGALTYDIAGNSFSGGTFTVKESVNGTVWTTLRTFSTLSAGSYDPYTDAPMNTTRYIRFEYTNKVSGNVGLDNINIALPVAGPNQEIDAMQGTDRIPTGGTAVIASAVSSTTTLNLTIENEGTVNALTISSAIVSGPNASEFVVTSTPSSINALSSATLSIDFTPTASGTRNAILTIVNNDSNENPYIINLYGVGGSFATEPGASPTNLSFSNVKSYRYRVTYVPTTADGYIVLRKKGSAVTDVPVDGVAYTKGEGIGTSKIAYVGTGATFVPRDVRAGLDYYYAVFAYNGPGVYINYKTVSPLTGMVTSNDTELGATFYNGIDRTSASFVTDLAGLINPHSLVFYSDYQRTIIEDFYERDTTNDQRVTTCVYSSFDHIYTPPMDFAVMSREHTICDSWMTTTGDNTTKQYQDFHNLFPTRLSGVNQTRSNYPLGEVVNVSSTYMDGTFGTNSVGQQVYEPRDEHKGDAARAMFYMLTAYHGFVTGWDGFDGLLSNASLQDQDVLKAWHWNDLPDALDHARNDYVDSLQGNRNPFVDSVDFVCFIDFNNMNKITSAAPCLTTPLGIEEVVNSSIISVYPNPANATITIATEIKNDHASQLIITDITGRQIQAMNISFAEGKSYFNIDIASLSSGIYQVELLNADGNRITNTKFVKE